MPGDSSGNLYMPLGPPQRCRRLVSSRRPPGTRERMQAPRSAGTKAKQNAFRREPFRKEGACGALLRFRECNLLPGTRRRTTRIQCKRRHPSKNRTVCPPKRGRWSKTRLRKASLGKMRKEKNWPIRSAQSISSQDFRESREEKTSNRLTRMRRRRPRRRGTTPRRTSSNSSSMHLHPPCLPSYSDTGWTADDDVDCYLAI